MNTNLWVFKITIMKKKILLFLLLITQTTIIAQSFELLDLNVSGDFQPKNFTEYNGLLIFQARGSNGDVELWKSDGTLSGTELIKDLDENLSSAPRNFIEFNGFLYFIAGSSASPSLWRTDGTEVGTTLVTNQAIPQGPFAILNNLLFFVGEENNTGKELWATDGTDAGTYLVKDINPSSWSSLNFNSQLITYNNYVIFSANDGTNGKELWKSDGTEAGTTMIKNITNNSESSNPLYFIEYKSKIYFAATKLSSGNELWKTDGTESGTELVEDNRAGDLSSNPSKFFTYSESLFFQAESDDDKGIEMHRYNLATNAVQRVADIYDGNGNGGFSPAIIYNEGMYFTASKPATGIELYVRRNGSNIFSEDTFVGTGSGSPTAFCNCGDKMYYRAYDGTENALFEFDISGNATKIKPSSATNQPFFVSTITELFCFNNELFFAANYTNSGFDLWKYSNTTLSINNEEFLENTISMYPNPVNSILNITSKTSLIDKIEVFNSIGKKIIKIKRDSFHHKLNTSHLSTGFYSLKIYSKGKTILKKLIVN